MKINLLLMKRQSNHVNILCLCAVLVAFAFPATVFSAQSLKVFILAGQSNMVGAGEMTSGAQGNLTYLVENDTDGTFEHLVDAAGDWIVRDDVWIWYNGAGNLSSGYGGSSTTIGPELQFGHVMGDYYNDPVLLIKTAWGGKSLAVDFRPPSSGDIDPPVAADVQGHYYREMMAIVADVLANLSTYFHDYEGQGYEIAGFGWHQGWNDRVNQAYNDEYEYNMANFIRDIRIDLGIPKLPFVIATTGMSGWEETHPRALSLMAAQLAMANTTAYPELEGNVAVVETRDFWRPAAESPSGQSYHWNRNAETYFLIGNAMAEEMAGLIDPNAPSVDAGDDMITWSGQAVLLDPNVVQKVGSDWTDLTYLWTAEPNGIGDPDLDVAITDADQEHASVTITKTAAGDAVTVTLTLAVNNLGRVDPPVQDTMTIDVYDDACKAAIGKGLAADNPTDIDRNCITGLPDFAVLATKWLTDNALTAPIIAPVPVTVPNVTGGSESAAQSILTGLGLTTSSTYQYDEVVPLNDVITQNPIAGSEVADGSNVSLVVSNGPPPVSEITIAGVYLAQTHVLGPDDPLFKLVGNRPTLLKVQVIAPNGTAVPPVTVVLSVDNETTTLTLDGPATLPISFEAALGKVEHRYDDSFTTLIPAEWIRPGLNIGVTAGNATVDHDIKVGAPTEVKMKMFDVHYFGLGNKDYPAGAFDELEAKWPVASLDIERIRDIDFLELVVPARSSAPNVRVTSKQDYKDQTGLNFDGEQAAALQWVEALSVSGGNFDVAMQYINIIGVPAGGQAGGFDGVGGISLGILNHELGHALSLPHWGNNSSYPYKGAMYGIEPQPGVYMGTHVGPTWAFDLPSMTFIPPTVQENSVGGEVGCYKKSPMQGGGVGDQEQGFFFRHFSDFAVNRMQSYIEGKVAVFRDGKYYKWDDQDGDYTRTVTSDGVRYPIEQDVQVISVMASTTLSDMNVNMVYPPIGPYQGNLILTFDPTNASDRATADDVFCPSGGCDFTLRVVQGGQQKTYMLPASGTEGGDPYSKSSLKTAAINLCASDGTVTQVELLLTPNAEKDGLPSNPEVLHIWTD